MPEKSTTDTIFTTHQAMEKYRKKRKHYYLAFLAYDKLPRAVFWKALQTRGVRTSSHSHKGHVRRIESGETVVTDVYELRME